ncbi:MAG: DUF4102 domain-containing protein [Gammaproteobacteria bacterium]|nr:DUF4102 domain-containing protein [Gammaproteobacteria bacterium]
MATKRRRINDSAKATGKAYEIRDSGNGSVKGLILRVQPSGHRTYYIEIARGIRERIGRQDAFTLQAARAEARRYSVLPERKAPTTSSGSAITGESRSWQP